MSVSVDEGVTWQYIGGPGNLADTRFFAHNGVIIAGDKYGGVWRLDSAFYVHPAPSITTSSDLIDFGTLDACGLRNADTTLLLKNNFSCDDVMVTSATIESSNGDFTVDAMPILPFVFGPHDSAGVNLHFHPSSLGKKNDRLHLVVHLGKDSADVYVSLSGTLQNTASAQLPEQGIRFDSVSRCDSSVTGYAWLKNTSCDSVRVTEFVAPNDNRFQLLTPLASMWVHQGDSIRVAVKFIPTTPGVLSDSLDFEIKLSSGNSRLVRLRLSASTLPGLSTLSVLDTLLDLGNISVCSHASGVIHFASAGCDSLHVTSESLQSANGWALTNAHQSVLAVGARDSSTLTFYPPGVGSFSTDVIIQTSAGNKTVHVTARGVADSGRVTLSTLALNLGSITARCDSSASQFTFTNTTCNPVTIDSMSAISNAFSRSSLSLPKLLASDSSVTVHVGFSPTATGTFAANLHLYFHGPDNREHDTVISLQGIGTSGATLGVELKPTTLSAQAGGAIDLPVYLDGALDAANAKAIGLQSVAMSLAWNTDLFSPMSATASIAGATVTNYSASNGNVDLAIALPAGFTFSGPTPLAMIHCQAFITDTLRTIAELARLTFNVAHNCLTLAAPNGSTEMVLNTICADSTISKTMAHGLAFAIESIVPNPTTGMLQVRIRGKQQLEYAIYDLLGREIRTGALQGRLDLHALPSGSYYLRITDGVNAQTRRVVRE